MSHEQRQMIKRSCLLSPDKLGAPGAEFFMEAHINVEFSWRILLLAVLATFSRSEYSSSRKVKVTETCFVRVLVKLKLLIEGGESAPD